MSTLKTTNLQSSDASSANIVLGQGSGGGATITGVTTTTTLETADSIIHTGDTDTKLRFPTANTITAETGGSERLRISNGGVNCTGISTAKTFVPTEGQLSHRNLVINGAMTIAQRGTTSTSAGYKTVDWRATNNQGKLVSAGVYFYKIETQKFIEVKKMNLVK